MKEEILAFQKANPKLSVSAIARYFGKHESTIRAHLFPKVRKQKTEYNRIQRQEKKKILVTEHGGKCQRCGYDKYVEALEFHHTDPTKKDFHITNTNKPIEEMRREALKCELLCPNCHREVHIELKLR